MRMLVSIASVAMLAALAFPDSVRASEPAPAFQVTPAEIELQGAFDRVQLVITRKSESGAVDEYCDDLTGEATYASSSADLVAVSPAGQVTAKGNGTGTITVSVAG
ncbi:MAG: hypothetical protein ACTHK7_03205, partial [Aureliella sp.]